MFVCVQPPQDIRHSAHPYRTHHNLTLQNSAVASLPKRDKPNPDDHTPNHLRPQKTRLATATQFVITHSPRWLPNQRSPSTYPSSPLLSFAPQLNLASGAKKMMLAQNKTQSTARGTWGHHKKKTKKATRHRFSPRSPPPSERGGCSRHVLFPCCARMNMLIESEWKPSCLA